MSDQAHDAPADAWDKCAEEAHSRGWMHDYGLRDMRERNPYRADAAQSDKEKTDGKQTS